MVTIVLKVLPPVCSTAKFLSLFAYAMEVFDLHFNFEFVLFGVLR